MILIIVIVAVILGLADILATWATHGELLRDTPENRKRIEDFLSNVKLNSMDRDIIMNDRIIGSIMYISRRRGISFMKYHVVGLGWISWFSPLARIIDSKFKELSR